MYSLVLLKARVLLVAWGVIGTSLMGCSGKPVSSSSATTASTPSSPQLSSASSSSLSSFDLAKGAVLYKSQCGACHDDGDSIGTKSGFAAKTDIDIINSSGQFICEYVDDCSSQSSLSDYIVSDMPWADAGSCVGECADNIAAYIIEVLQNSTPVIQPGDDDEDGVENTNDQCPSVAGPKRNHGCPVPAGTPAPMLGNQVKGASIYTQQCQTCHGNNGGGTNVGPSLIQGECTSCSDFGSLVDTIEMSMPTPGACVDECAIDTATYIVSTFTTPIAFTQCDMTPINPGKFPLRRLNKREYTNTIVDLFGVDRALASDIPAEQNSGFDNDAGVLGVTPSHVDAFIGASKAVASAFANTLNTGSVVPASGDQCNLTTECRASYGPSATDCVNSSSNQSYCLCGNDRCDASSAPASNNSLLNCMQFNDDCAFSFIKDAGQKIYRRPITSAEEISLRKLYNAGKSIDFAAGIQLVVEGMLQSPAFLYRAEFGRGSTAQAGIVPLSSWEMATRLSYMFWATTPDDTLLALAAQNKLTNPTIIAEQAKRLLENERAKAVVRVFFQDLIQKSKILAVSADKIAYPHFTDNTPQLYLKELDAFVDHVMWQSDSSWDEFLSADYTFVNNALATVYGFNSPGSDQYVQVSEQGRHFGLLSLGALMASRAHENETAPVLRGAFILQSLMCVNIELPEADQDLELKPPVPDPNATTRHRWAQATKGAECEGCHRTLNPAGFAFENFDPTGRWRERDAGQPVDVSIDLLGTDISGMYAGPADFVNALVQSQQVAECAVNLWAQFSYGHEMHTEVGGDDECSMRNAYTVFTRKNKSVKELLIALTQTDAFLYTREVK